MHTKSGIYLPPVPIPRPRGHRRRWSPHMAIGALVNPDGSIEQVDWEWRLNALHDAGEQAMLNDFNKEQAAITKYLGLLNDASVAETDGTMSAVTETTTAGTNGYNRQQILSTDWTDDGLIGGDYRFTATEKTFGPISGSAQTATHTSESSTSTGAGILIATVALSATTVIAVNQSLKIIFRHAQS